MTSSTKTDINYTAKTIENDDSNEPVVANMASSIQIDTFRASLVLLLFRLFPSLSVSFFLSLSILLFFLLFVVVVGLHPTTWIDQIDKTPLCTRPGTKHREGLKIETQPITIPFILCD